MLIFVPHSRTYITMRSGVIESKSNSLSFIWEWNVTHNLKELIVEGWLQLDPLYQWCKAYITNFTGNLMFHVTLLTKFEFSPSRPALALRLLVILRVQISFSQIRPKSEQIHKALFWLAPHLLNIYIQSLVFKLLQFHLISEVGVSKAQGIILKPHWWFSRFVIIAIKFNTALPQINSSLFIKAHEIQSTDFILIKSHQFNNP